METRMIKLRKILFFAFAAALTVLCVLALSIQTTAAEGDDDKDDGDRPDISIEVVEDIPAADIEEQEIPLAESPNTAAADNTRLAMTMWIIAAVLIAYTVFIVSGMRRRKARRLIKAGADGDRGDESSGGAS